MSLLSIEDLHVHFVGEDRLGRPVTARALNGVSLTLEQGQRLGLVGETGAGKSLTVQALMGLLRAPARLVRGRALFEGVDLLALDEAKLNRLRGAAISMVVQSPKTSLDPVRRIGDQIVRIQQAHAPVSRAQAWRRAIDLLEKVGVADAERRAMAYPHQFSGGMAQRVLIAMALAHRPRLIVADEPTTGLDATVQAQVLDLLTSLVREEGASLLVITHDIGVVAHYCDKVAVMFAGVIVESGPVEQVFGAPAHPYTQALLAATPERIEAGGKAPRAGLPPDLRALPEGCVYSDRCPIADASCRTVPPERLLGVGHLALCHHVAPQREARA